MGGERRGDGELGKIVYRRQRITTQMLQHCHALAEQKPTMMHVSENIPLRHLRFNLKYKFEDTINLC